MNIARTIQIVMSLLIVSGIVMPALSAQTTLISSQLCAVVTDVRNVIGILALVLFIIGGVMYAIAHFLPSVGNIKSNMQGWSMGMVLGGIIGVIIVIIAPSIVGLITGFAGSGVNIATGC